MEAIKVFAFSNQIANTGTAYLKKIRQDIRRAACKRVYKN